MDYLCRNCLTHTSLAVAIVTSAACIDKRLPFYKVVHNIALPGTGLSYNDRVWRHTDIHWIIFQSNGWPNAEEVSRYLE